MRGLAVEPAALVAMPTTPAGCLHSESDLLTAGNVDAQPGGDLCPARGAAPSVAILWYGRPAVAIALRIETRQAPATTRCGIREAMFLAH